MMAWHACRSISCGRPISHPSLKLQSHLVRYLSTGDGSNLLPNHHPTHASPSSSAEGIPSDDNTRRSDPLLSLDYDSQSLYSDMTSKELMLSLLNLHLLAHEPLVDAGIKVLKSPAMKQYPALRHPILAIAKKTVYTHFCAGTNAAEASNTLQRMWDLGLKSILNYGQEDAMDNTACDHNLECFLQTIQQIKELPRELVSFFCVKITAVCPIPLLEHVSMLLRWQQKHPQFRLPWKEDTLPLLADESPNYLVQMLPDPLSTMEEEGILIAKKRLWTLARACEEAGLPLLVDAEYMTVQPAIDYLTNLAVLEFNRRGKLLVYGTIQAYMKDAFPRLTLASDDAFRRGVQFGVKLVRGAYLTREKSLAAFLCIDSPIHSTIQQTHNCYDTCAAFMMERAARGQGSVLLATHNFDSGRKAATKANELGLKNKNPRLQFGQLKGMADTLSLALAQAGFHVSKYVPFGPVGDVIPYLIRRAEENRGVLRNTQSDRLHIWEELKRRSSFWNNLA